MKEANEKSVWENNPPQNHSVQNNLPKRVPAAETEYTVRMKKNFAFFGPATFLYAVFYAFCMYKNGSGAAFPFFMAGSLLYLCLCLSKLEISLKKGSGWYMTGMMLLAVSTFCTDDRTIIGLNKTGIFFLMMSLLLKQFYDTSKWTLGKYLFSITELVFASLGEICRPFADMRDYLKDDKNARNKKLWSAVLGALIALPLLLIVTALLSSADLVFRRMTDRFYEWIQPANLLNVALRITFLFFASYLPVSFLCKKTLSEEIKDRRRGEPVLAVTVTGLLTLLYLMFSSVQIFGLFLRKMTLPEGYTYAEYARQGFFQLLAVSILNLIIVLFVMSFFKESRLLKIILTIMSLCTFVMIASSAMRMVLYVNQYDLTFLRIFVLWALAVLTLLFAGVLIRIFRESFPLFRYCMAVVTTLYLVLSFSHPDYIIARVNLRNPPLSIEEAHYGGEGEGEGCHYVDFRYLAGLSTDAAPVLIPYLNQLGYDLKLYGEEDVLAAGEKANDGEWFYDHEPEGFGWYYLHRIKSETEQMSLRTYNVSRHMALWLLESFSEDGDV